MEPRDPLGSTGAPLRSQVRNKNSGGGRDSAASDILREGASIIRMVTDAGVVSGAVGLVANVVTAAVEGISGRRFHREVEGISSRRSRRDVLSHIEHSRDRKATRLYESLGMILNNIVHPPRTTVYIAKDYREAQRSL